MNKADRTKAEYESDGIIDSRNQRVADNHFGLVELIRSSERRAQNRFRNKADIYDGQVINDYRHLFGAAKVMQGALDMADAFDQALERATTGKEALIDALVGFRGQINNDLKSISSSGERVRDEVRKVSVSIQSAVTILTGADMEKALSNAERLVTALQAIQELKSTRLAFAVVDGHTPETTSSS